MKPILFLVAVAIVAPSTGCGSSSASPVRGSPGTASAPTTGVVESNDARIAYQVHGDLNAGTPVLVLHGTFMSADAMKPLVERLAKTRAVIAIDQRGHGRSGDHPGPATYEAMSDDAANVLAALRVPTADVVGYSMGANVAILLATRHPTTVRRMVVLSGTFRKSGWHPEVHAAIASLTPGVFAGTPLETSYKQSSPTPEAFPVLVEKMKVMEKTAPDVPEDEIRAFRGKTMIVVGDADAVQLDHALELFQLAGGGDKDAVVKGFMTKPPRARLAILPGTSHIGIMANPDLVVSLVTPFLDDIPEPPPTF
jgi:pimeloyl-ACP methyl ester carboxylesterase